MTKLAPTLAQGQSSLEDDTVSLVHGARPRTSSVDKAKKVASQLKNVSGIMLMRWGLLALVRVEHGGVRD